MASNLRSLALKRIHRRIPTEGATQEALIALADWIARQGEISESEKTWWMWKLALNCEYQPHLGKALANHWLDKPEISAESKRELCWGWLTGEREVGTLHQLTFVRYPGHRRPGPARQVAVAGVGVKEIPYWPIITGKK